MIDESVETFDKDVTPVTELSAEDLSEFPVTLQTFLSITNVWISSSQRLELFNRLQDYSVENDDIPYKKKKKEPYTKQVNAPVGRIFGMSCGENSWGIVKTKKSQHFDSCKEDQLLKEILTGETDSKDTFKNALCIYMSMPKNNIHIMRFSDILKIAGCKNVDECILAVTLLWRHIEPHTDCYKIMHAEGENSNIVKHSFDSSMINLNFSANYIIDREKFLSVLNEKYKNHIKDARWQDSQNNILVRFNQNHKKEQLFRTIFFPKDNPKQFCIADITRQDLNDIRELIYAYNPKASRKNDKKIKPIRVKVNRTSTVMATGRYLDNIIESCNFIMNVLKDNETDVVEVLKENYNVDPDFDIKNFLI